MVNRAASYTTVIIVLLVLAYGSFIHDSSGTLEVYSFTITGELTICSTPEINGSSDCNLSYPVIKTLHTFLNIDPGTAMIAGRLQLDTGLIWAITITGATANTSKGIIKDQGIVNVTFIPLKGIIVVAHFAFLTGPYIFGGSSQ